ncbi:MAG: hypothetical protein J5952_06390 [Prevotella sp.]|nr:hypothetical protein [Prevotella sp.]
MAQREYNKLFVGGDLSGIQKFLYNITSRHASVSLKGRSAFLSNYLREVCNKIEDTIIGYGGTYDELYCSGGKFYLITDNTPEVTKAIDECARQTKEKLWNEHKGQLGLNICHVTYQEENGKFNVEGHEDEHSTFSGVLWKYVNAKFAQQKNQKFRDLMTSHPDKFFSFDTTEDSKELIVGGGHKVCALTGVEFDITKLEKGTKYTIEGDNDLFYLPSAIQQIEEGKKLSKKDGMKSFEEYADGSYLGILRMDVDGMGKRFIIGFPTIKDYKAFSEKARKFFEEDIKNKLLQEEIKDGPDKGKKYKEFLNIIYAGGDDLFIVGRWDKVIDFAKIIHDETSEEFKGEAYIDIFDPNKPERQISISGGIAIVKPKFPIAKAADMAGEAEDAAKQGEKNAFNMFGRTVSWNKKKPFKVNNTEIYESEYAYVEHYKDVFVDYITKYDKSYGFSKSILHKIMLYSEIADKNVEREAMGKTKNYRYIWHISYYMTRYMDKYKNFGDDNTKKTLYTFCRKLRDEHLSKNLGLMALSARWAELLLKENEE